MAQVTVYHDAEVTVAVLEGAPPADQSALIADLRNQIATLQAKIDAAKAAAQRDKDADAANVAGQAVLDALG